MNKGWLLVPVVGLVLYGIYRFLTSNAPIGAQCYVAGRVVDASTEQPIVGCLLTYDDGRTATSGANGTFKIGTLSQSVNVTFSASGHIAQTISFTGLILNHTYDAGDIALQSSGGDTLAAIVTGNTHGLPASMNASGSYNATIKVKNTGTVAGAITVQVGIGFYPNVWPDKLSTEGGVAIVTLSPGVEQDVQVPINLTGFLTSGVMTLGVFVRLTDSAGNQLSAAVKVDDNVVIQPQ